MTKRLRPCTRIRPDGTKCAGYMDRLLSETTWACRGCDQTQPVRPRAKKPTKSPEEWRTLLAAEKAEYEATLAALRKT